MDKIVIHSNRKAKKSKKRIIMVRIITIIITCIFFFLAGKLVGKGILIIGETLNNLF